MRLAMCVYVESQDFPFGCHDDSYVHALVAAALQLSESLEFQLDACLASGKQLHA